MKMNPQRSHEASLSTRPAGAQLASRRCAAMYSLLLIPVVSLALRDQHASRPLLLPSLQWQHRGSAGKCPYPQAAAKCPDLEAEQLVYPRGRG